MDWASKDLSSKLSLTNEGNVMYYKSVHHPISNQPTGIEKTLAIFKTNQEALLSIVCLGVFYS